jgi:transcriptional pleiotropic regulator of transition state genes
MKSLGMARKVDDLGRIVLPVELRRLFGIKPGDELEISVDEGAVLLRKIEARCVFCDAVDGLRQYRDKQVCPACAIALGRTAGAAGERELVDAASGHPEGGGDSGDR